MLLEALRQADEWEEIGETSHDAYDGARWLPEVSNDVRSLGLSQEYIEVLCLSNGDIPLQVWSLVLMLPEARVARFVRHLFDLHLIEVVDTALETNFSKTSPNIIIRASIPWRSNANPLILTSICWAYSTPVQVHQWSADPPWDLCEKFTWPWTYTSVEIVRYLERRFTPSLQLLARQQYPIFSKRRILSMAT